MDKPVFFRGRDTGSIFLVSGPNYVVVHGRGFFRGKEGAVLHRRDVMAGTGIEPIQSPFHAPASSTMTAISEELSDERKHSPELVAALLNLKAKLEALPEPLRGPFVVEGLKPYLRSGNGGEVRVRKLEWLSGYGVEAEYAEPVTDIRYSVHRDDHNGGWVLFTGNAAREGNKHRAASRDEAKAAAQADYETRILSALDIKP